MGIKGLLMTIDGVKGPLTAFYSYEGLSTATQGKNRLIINSAP